MQFCAEEILSILDRCCEAFTFPALDNGYVYLAATRLSLHRSVRDWAMVIEVFGFSPRAGLPDTHIFTFASKLHDRDPPERYVSRTAYDNYLTNNPHNECRFSFPLHEGSWQDALDGELVADDENEVVVRGQSIRLPTIDEYATQGIELETPPRVQVFELCRYLAATMRDAVLGTPDERRVSVPTELTQVLQLEEWHHPDIVGGTKASQSETFRQLAQVLETGNVAEYQPSQPPNTHWRNWPEGGRL